MLSSLLLQKVGSEGGWGGKNMMSSFSLSPTTTLFLQNGERGDAAISAHHGGQAWGEEVRALPPWPVQHPPEAKLLGLSPCSLSPHPAARPVSSGDDSKIPAPWKPYSHPFSKGIPQMLFLVGYTRFLVSAVEASGSIAQHCSEVKSAKK